MIYALVIFHFRADGFSVSMISGRKKQGKKKVKV